MSEFRRNIMMFNRPVASAVTVPVPTISPAAGAILASQTITIGISGIATSAEYSTDNENWTTYSSPFTLASAATVYARATDGNGNYSSVVSNAYTILPYDAEVEYLQSSGTQYINLTCSVASGTFFSVSGIIVPLYKNTNRYAVFGANPYQQFNVNFYSRNTSTYFMTYTSTIGTASSGGGWGGIEGEVLEFELSTTGMTTNGSTTSLSRPLTAAITGFRLFGGYQNTNRYPIKIRTIKIVAGTTTLYDLKAVRKNGVGYMYDALTGNLLGNNGSGSFSYGNDITT